MTRHNTYRVLARKYRPQRFTDVIGQEPLVQLLQNGLTQGRLGHSFLFTGIRGTGKTTLARLLARTLNCEKIQDIHPIHQPNTPPSPEQLSQDTQSAQESHGVSEKTEILNPCGNCPSCLASLEDRHFDIVEMDAASHTGVDDIRELLESVRYRPVVGKYKVPIIDEVHMLSKSAFNALLKTLEDPPEHVKFIFATTEVHKIPATVLSRCLRFDLKRISSKVLVPHLEALCRTEGVQAEKEALQLIAIAGEGSARDSLSILDQAILMADDDHFIRKSAIQAMLGLVDSDSFTTVFSHLLEGKTAEVLSALETLYQGGADPFFLLQETGRWLHGLSCLLAGSELPEELLAHQIHFTQWCKNLDLGRVGQLWQLLQKGIEELKQTDYPLQALEMIFLRLLHAQNLPSPEKLWHTLTCDSPSESVNSENSLLKHARTLFPGASIEET